MSAVRACDLALSIRSAPSTKACIADSAGGRVLAVHASLRTEVALWPQPLSTSRGSTINRDADSRSALPNLMPRERRWHLDDGPSTEQQNCC